MRVGKLLDAMDRATSARELKHQVMDGVPELFGAGALGIYLFDDRGALAEIHTRGVRDGFLLVYEQLGREHDPILARALGTQRTTHDADVFRRGEWPSTPLYRECGGPWQIRHYLCAPIVADGAVVGTLNIARRHEEHPFGATESAWATAVSRKLAVGLQAFAGRPGEPRASTRPSIEDLGRLLAERTQLRLRARELERTGRLSEEEAGALWDALVAKRIAPLDTFDQGDRTYIVLSRPSAADPAAALTPRETEVCLHAAAGLANKQIAFELGISPNTVGAVLLSARRKLGVSSRVKLVEIVRRLQLSAENDSAASSARELTPSLRKIVAI